MKFERILTFILCFLGTLSPIQAEPGIALSSGQGIHSITPYRFAFSWDFGSLWEPQIGWALRGVWETSIGIWDGPERSNLTANRPCNLALTTTGPMLKWQKRHPWSRTSIVPYSEIGVGLSWLSEKEIQGRILSLHFQFEDKAGIGFRFGQNQQYDLSLRAYHYSNASLKRPNSGVNLAMVSFGVWFPK